MIHGHVAIYYLVDRCARAMYPISYRYHEDIGASIIMIVAVYALRCMNEEIQA